MDPGRTSIGAARPGGRPEPPAFRDGEHVLLGRQLGEFVIEERLGAGGFGVVYRATQALLGRAAVVKVLQPRLRATGEMTDRFLREAQLASRLDHPFAAHIYAFGAERDGTLWIAMELVRGSTLADYLDEHGPMPIERFVPLLERICEVVHTAHEQGIVHRDLKPANVMVLSRAGRLLPKLLDFGIAKSIFAGGDSPRPDAAAIPVGDTEPDAALRGDETIRPHDAAPASATPPHARITPRGDLTQRGAMMGSPHYMAPEQWLDAASVDARTDLYALAILSYEALTGSVPFRGKSMSELMMAHSTDDVPPLPDTLPKALHDVFARALAKDPADRFEDALHLAEAFRVASGLAVETRPLPQLEEPVRERWLADGPQPLAEAIAALESARDARQARDALWTIVGTLVRYVGLLALAARSRQATHDRPPAAVSAIRRLGTAIPTDAEWLEIAHALVRSHADRPDLHPLPELVLFLCDPEGGPGEGIRLARQLEDMRSEAGASSDEVVRQRLEGALVVLSALLRRCEFLCDYALVVPSEDGVVERWAGVRRPRRVTVETRGAALAAGQPLLIDRDGAPVLSLHPLVQVESPAPGTAAELFLFAGRDTRGGKLTAAPQPFEVHQPKVLDWLRVQLATTLEEVEHAAEDAAAPYLGLRPFGPEDAHFFFGRERLVEAFVNRLRVHPLLVVAGQSGAGKSSFVHAGVVPALGSTWRALTMRPGPSPLAALGARLVAAGVAAQWLGAALATTPALLGELLREDATARGPLLLVVDQFEELFTLARDEHERDVFAAALVAAARSAEDGVRVVLTLRDDFLVKAEALPALRDRLAQSLQLLTTPARAELERIVTEPARRAGYEFEDPELPARMVAEVAERPGALALISFTAARLWDARDRHFKRLSTRAYEGIGGVGGALAQHAEALLESLAADKRGLVRRAFSHLVTSEGTRAVLSRAELRERLGGGTSADIVLETLVDGRLLVAFEAEDGEDRVEIIHEALLSAWPRLVEWRRDDEDGARLRDQLRGAVKQWEERGRPRALLWRGELLADLQRWRATQPVLTRAEEAFADASRVQAVRGRRILWAGIASAFVALSMVATILFVLQRRAELAQQRAEEARQQTHAHLVESYEEQGRRALLDGDTNLALLYLSEAYQMGADSPALQFMIARALEPLEAEAATLRGHEGQVLSAQFSPDGDRVLTTSDDGTARVWDAATAREAFRLPGHARGFLVAAYAPDGRSIATADLSGTIRLWAADTGEAQETFEVPVDPARSNAPALAFAPEGRRLAIAGFGQLALVDLEERAAIVRHDMPQSSGIDVAFDPTGSRLVVVQDDRAAIVDVAGELVAELRGHTAPIWWARFGPDGALVGTASLDKTARLWDAASGQARHELRGHEQRVVDLAFGPKGELVATASADGTAKLWNTATGALERTLRGHNAQVNFVRFAPDGAHIFTAGADGTARAWDTRTGIETAMFAHEGFVSDVRVDGRATMLATASWLGTAKLWSLARQPRLRSWHAEEGFEALPPTTDGTVVAWSRGGGARVWTADGEPAASIASGPLVAIERSSDGRVVALLEEGGALSLHRTRDGALVKRVETQGTSLAFDAEARRIVTIGHDATPSLWDAETGARLRQSEPIATEPQAAWFLTPSPRGDRVAVTDLTSKTATLLAFDDLHVIARLEGHAGPIWSAVWSTDGERIVTTSADRSARVWTSDGELLERFDHEADVFPTAWSPNADRLLTGSADGTATLWTIADGSHESWSAHQTFVLATAFAPDGSVVATAGGEGTVRFWAVPSVRELHAMSTGSEARQLAFSGSGDRIGVHGTNVIEWWRASSSSLSRASLREIVRCRLSQQLEAGKPVAAPPEGRTGC